MIDSYGQHDVVDQSEPVYEELSGGYKMTNAIVYASEMQMPQVWDKEQWVNGNLQSMSASRMPNGDGKWFN